MARYDRIAPLSSPERDHAFPCWPVLRDIEGQDRDADACRRARLRFLALRPVRRLVDSTVSAESFSRQLEVIREELRGLATHDAERVRITRFLRQIEDREPTRLIQALLDFAEQAHVAGHVHAAQEYAATANVLQAGAAGALQARLQASDSAQAEDHAATLERSWAELRHTDEAGQRALILERMGRALMSLNLLTAADRCFTIITQRQTDLPTRSRVRAAHALLAALAGDGNVFRERRDALLRDDVEWTADPRVAALVQIDLGHGCVVAGDLDDAREHVRTAITIARRQGYAEPLQRAETILTALEKNTEVLLHPQQTSEAAQRIAAQIESLQLPAPTA